MPFSPDVEYNFYVVGNIGPETIKIGDSVPVTEVGGSLMHVAAVAAHHTQPTVLFGGLSGSNRDWPNIHTYLEDNGVNTAPISQLLTEYEIRFGIQYTDTLELLEMTVINAQTQGVGVAAWHGWIEAYLMFGGKGGNSLTLICPLPPELQEGCVKDAERIGSVVALSTHMNLLESKHNREKFSGLLPRVTFISMNSKEAELLTSKRVEEAGVEIAQTLPDGGVVFITDNIKGVSAFCLDRSNNKVRLLTVEAANPNRLVDVTGAGDVFFGDVVLELLDRRWNGSDLGVLKLAMEQATILVAEKLGTYGYTGVN